MASSLQSNTANNIREKRQHSKSDERTPLLEGWENTKTKGYLVASDDAAVRADEEAARCENPLSDKPPRGPIPQNVAGVISILLLGTCLVFLQFKFNFPCPWNPLCISPSRQWAGHSVDFHTALSDVELRSSADRGIYSGVFVANADSSLVLATSGTISSEFQDFENAGWIITSYTLAMCATQSLVRL
jgi:hypothetical protein